VPAPDLIQRQVLKFLLPSSHAAEMAARIGEHVPAYAYGGGPTLSRVTSLYLDSADLDLYRQSVERPESAALIRLRWYSGPPGSPVFLELKHRDVERAVGVKQRYVLPRDTTSAFSGSEAQLEAVAEHVETQAGAAIRGFLARCHVPPRAANLQPKLYVRYRRQAFQASEDAPLRITLDSRIIMAAAGGWPHERASHRTRRFSHAILEVKLEDGRPPWLDALLADACLTPLANFSKWVEGLTSLS
jgi:SPX domain protein involved in polyphosphate accumulation